LKHLVVKYLANSSQTNKQDSYITRVHRVVAVVVACPCGSLAWRKLSLKQLQALPCQLISHFI